MHPIGAVHAGSEVYEAICVGIRAECRACCVQSTDPENKILPFHGMSMRFNSEEQEMIDGSLVGVGEIWCCVCVCVCEEGDSVHGTL